MKSCGEFMLVTRISSLGDTCTECQDRVSIAPPHMVQGMLPHPFLGLSRLLGRTCLRRLAGQGQVQQPWPRETGAPGGNLLASPSSGGKCLGSQQMSRQREGPRTDVLSKHRGPLDSWGFTRTSSAALGSFLSCSVPWLLLL